MQYSKKGKSYIFPFYAGRPEVIIPRSSMQWLLEQPDDVLSIAAAYYDILHAKYTFTNPYLMKEPYHNQVLRRSLTRQLEDRAMDIWDELQCVFRETWGLDNKK